MLFLLFSSAILAFGKSLLLGREGKEEETVECPLYEDEYEKDVFNNLIAPTSYIVIVPPEYANLSSIYTQQLEENIKQYKNDYKLCLTQYPIDSHHYKVFEFYLKIADSYIDYKSIANKDLSKINKETDVLILEVTAKDYSDSIDFGLLPAPMRVTVFPSDYLEGEEKLRELAIKRSKQTAFNFKIPKMLANTFGSKHISVNNVVGFPNEAIINGDCKGKVTSLAIDGNVRFVGSSCTANNLILDYCSVNETGKGIDSDYVYYADDDVSIPIQFFPLKRQYRAFNFYSNPLCGIKFYKEYAVPKMINNRDQEELTDLCIPLEEDKIYYNNSTEQYGFVSLFSSIELEADDNIKSIHNCNISIQLLRYIRGLKYDGYRKIPTDKINVTLKGKDWEKMGKQSIIIEAEDPDILEIDSSVASMINIEKKKPFVYVPNNLEGPKKLSVGEIVGIAVGCVAIVGIIVGICVYFFVCRKNKAASSASNK